LLKILVWRINTLKNETKEISRIGLGLLFLLVFLSCRTVSPFPVETLISPPLQKPRWKVSEYSSVKILDFSDSVDSSIPVGGAALTLDLSSLHIEIILTPADASGRGETLSARTTEFARQQEVQIALNGSPYDPVDLLNRSARAIDIVGLQISHRLLVSPGEDSFDALFVLADGTLELGSQAHIPEETTDALGGFHLLLQEGRVLGVEDARHPRTAIGLSEDGRTLVIAVFDGRQKNRAGLTTEETALWMKWLGCTRALNLDGGGSSTLVMIDRDGVVHVLNNPVHRGRPGLERAVGNHLGIRLIR
jgi:hypothetical protein